MFTFAVIHCNRLHYLKNCVNSIIEFVGLNDINLLVIDNNSSESGVHEYLSSLPSEVDIKQFNKRSPHELHKAMNFAIKYSREKNNQYVNFIQEDYQYLYSHPKMLQWIHDAFEAQPKVVQLQTNMGWRRKIRKLGKPAFVDVYGIKWQLFRRKPPCDNGFTRIALYDKIGFYPKKVSIHGREKGFTAGESWIKSKCNKFRRMMLAESNMGMLMDCAFVRKGHRIGKYFPPPNRYYLKPFDKDKQQQVKEIAQKGEVCFIEDLIEPDGWKPDKMARKHSERDIRVKV